MRRLLLILTVLALLSGCKTQERIVAVTDYRTDTLMLAKVVRDSVWMMDSVFVREYAVHDTVFVETTRWRTKTVERLRTDTLYQSRVDSARAEVVTVVKNGKASWRQLTIKGVIEVLACILIACALKHYNDKKRRR